MIEIWGIYFLYRLLIEFILHICPTCPAIYLCVYCVCDVESLLIPRCFASFLFKVIRVLWRGCGGCGSWGDFNGVGGCEEGWDAGWEVTRVFTCHWWAKCPSNSCNIDLTASIKGCKLFNCSWMWFIFFLCSCWHWRFSSILVWHQQW